MSGKGGWIRKLKPQRYEVLGDITRCFIERRDGSVVVFIFSTRHLETVRQYRWMVHKSGGSGEFYIWESRGGSTLRLSDLIMNTPEGLMVDHINLDPLNNCDENLRLCTKSQNQMNTRLRGCSTSGMKGVSFHKRIKRWQAYISIDGKRQYLGYFDTAEEASQAYQNKAKALFGEFVRLS